MNIEEFANSCNTSIKTVKKWIDSSYIPSAVKKDNDYFIPDSARQPYTKARAKTGSAIIKSILTACDKRYWTGCALYGISEKEFQSYIEQLEKGGYINSLILDDVKYYNITIKGCEYLCSKSKLKKLCEHIVSIISNAVGCCIASKI